MYDISSWVFLILGLLGGFSLSFVFWWVTNHHFVPDIQFSEEVSRSKASFIDSGIRYQIALKNCGKRDAYNVKYRAAIEIKDILQNGGQIWDTLDVPLSNNEYFVLAQKSMFRVTPMFNKIQMFSKLMFSKNIIEKYDNGILTLDDLFDEYDDIIVYLEVIATDRFSGGSRVFRSKEYTKHDVRSGVFKKNNHLAIHKQAKVSKRNDIQ